MPDPRVILHVDMDAFFAAVEQLDNPDLQGKPVLVGSHRARGVVAAASYESRTFGCRSAMPMAVAKRLCPQAIVVPVRGSRYREVSDHLFRIFDDFSPLVEPLSIDEAFLDVTGTERVFGHPHTLAVQLKQRIRDELHLAASIGLAPNKFLAKLASDAEKPDGLTVVHAADARAWLAPLPIERMWGIGPKTAERLARAGLRTIGDLARMSVDFLTSHVGRDGARYHRLAQGLDDRPVTPDGAAKSIGHEQTFEQDVADVEAVRTVLLDQSEQVARRLRKHHLRARTISLKIRFGEFQTISRSATLEAASCTTATLWHTARQLFDRWAAEAFVPVRLIGMHASQLTAETTEQMGLFTDAATQRQSRLDQAADRIVDRFGKTAIRRGLRPST
ncbi:MAG: DNA polymerase IV [Phycisphaeraceae bacterium]